LQSYTKIFCSLTICLLLAGVSSSAQVRMEEIKAAVIDQDFQEASQLSQDFLDQKISRKEEFEARYFLGLSQLRLAEYQAAQEAFDYLLDQKLSDPLYEKASFGLIDTYLLTGQYEKVLSQVKFFEKRHPKSSSLSLIYLKKARAYLKLAQWDDADRYLKIITQTFPNSLEYPIATQLLEEERYFAVQVGSFLDRGLAARLVGELKDRGEYAYIVETVSQAGKTFYRVRVGQFTRLNQAMLLERRLSGLGYPTRIYP